MPEVAFYVLSAGGPDAVPRFACRLAETAWQRGHRVFLNAGSAAAAQQLDSLLWTYRQDAFLPHALYAGAMDADTPVWVGDGRAPDRDLDVLINLAATVPLFFECSARVADIVGPDAEARARGRDRFRAYRERGLDIATHNL